MIRKYAQEGVVFSVSIERKEEFGEHNRVDLVLDIENVDGKKAGKAVMIPVLYKDLK